MRSTEQQQKYTTEIDARARRTNTERGVRTKNHRPHTCCGGVFFSPLKFLILQISKQQQHLAYFVKSLDCGFLERASCSSAQTELPVVRLQDPSSEGETSNPIEEVWIARLITAAVESTTMRERERHTHTHRETDRRTDR